MNPLLLLVAGVGALFLLRRPRAHPRANPPLRHRNPKLCEKDQRQLEAAQRLSEEFHGNRNQVWELEPHERHLSRFVVKAGSLQDFTYDPGRGSKKGDALYEHEAGDRGLLAPKAREKPLLVVDPKTRRPALVPNRSPMKLTERGFVG